MCWKTSTAGSLIPRLEEAYPQVQIRDAIYSASEGWCNVPYTDKNVGGPLAVNAHFYEFIEVDENKPDTEPEVKLAHELEVGKDYRILITNSAGMYRYDLGDVLQVSHYYHTHPVCTLYAKWGNFQIW